MQLNCRLCLKSVAYALIFGLIAYAPSYAEPPGVGMFVQEADGDPAGYAIRTQFPNGTLSFSGSTAIYAGESGAAAEVQDEAVTAGNFNADTSHAVSQDDFWDWEVQFDTDMDGDFTDEAWFPAAGNITDEASLYSTLSDVTQFYEPGDLLRTEASDTPTTPSTNGEMVFDNNDDQFIFRVGGANKTFDFSGDSVDYVLKSDGSGNFSLAADVTGSGGSAIVLDLADDAANESTDITELATTGDTNSVFSEPSANKLLINAGNNWPTADTATTANAGDSATAFFSAGTIEHEYGGLEANVSAYDGLVNISGGTTSAVTLSTVGETFIGQAAYDDMAALLSVDHLITLSGVAQNSDNLGTFTGTTIPDSSTIKAALQELETEIEAGGGGAGDITGVLGDTGGDVPVLYQTFTAFTAADATPDVSTASFWRTIDTTTITDFDGTPVDGQFLATYCGAATVFDLTASGLEAANRTTDLTCDVGSALMWFYRTDTWYCANCPDEYETLSVDGLVVNDSGTPEAVSIDGGGLAVSANSDGTAGNPTITVTAATASNINTGTSTTTAVTPDALAGSTLGSKTIIVQFEDPGDTLTTGDGKAYFTVPPELDGMNLVSAQGAVYTASSSGTPTFQMRDVTNGHDMFSTLVTIDASEFNSSTAASPAVISTTYDDVATGDRLRIDCDAAGTGTAGGEISLTFRLP